MSGCNADDSYVFFDMDKAKAEERNILGVVFENSRAQLFLFFFTKI